MTNIVNESMDRSETILQLLEDTFGDDKRVEFAYSRYQEILQGGEELSYAIARTYLEWCVANPGLIGKKQETVPCRCNSGWIIDDEVEKRWKPCPRCLSGAYDLWMANFTDAPPGEEFEDDDNEWDKPSYGQQGF